MVCLVQMAAGNMMFVSESCFCPVHIALSNSLKIRCITESHTYMVKV